jgi:hypothetical protein
MENQELANDENTSHKHRLKEYAEVCVSCSCMRKFSAV